MEAKNSQLKGHQAALTYVLEDFLEVKASLDAKKTRALKQFLFSRPLNGHQVSSVEGFLLANHLVVVNEGDPGAVEHLVFLSPRNGRIRINCLKS